MKHFGETQYLRHHALAIGAEKEAGIGEALAWMEKELGMRIKKNPDIVVLRYGLLSVEDARSIIEAASGAPLQGEHRAIVIAADRAYREAQNALLKLFEEPPPNTFLFLILPSLGSLLPTLRSRVQILDISCPISGVGHDMSNTSGIAGEFVKASREKRSAMIKKVAEHKGGDAASAREEAIALLNGVEAIVFHDEGLTFIKYRALLEDIQILRSHLYDRSAPMKMILEHLALVVPKDLV